MKWLEELEQRAKAATSGKWEYNHNGMMQPPTVNIGTYQIAEVTSSDRDAIFIAEANPQTILALCDKIRASEEVLHEALELTHHGNKMGCILLLEEFITELRADPGKGDAK